MQDDLNEEGKSLVNTYVKRYGGLMDNTEVWRYLPQSVGDDVVERVREAGHVYYGELGTFSQPSKSTKVDVERSDAGKYAPHYERLVSSDSEAVQFNFCEINRLLNDPLPDSAYKYRVWWNESGHSHAKGWESLGWTVSSLDLSGQIVEFEKK